MTDTDPPDITLQVINALENLGVRYVIVGSMASIVHGLIRSTMDTDILVDLEAGHVLPFVGALQDVFHIDERTVQVAIERRRNFSLIHPATMFKVAVFISQQRPFDEQQFIRRTPAEIRSGSDKFAWVLSPEEVILAKLDWFRLGGDVS
jgi:hypothetical protein